MPEQVAASPAELHDLLVAERVDVLCQTPSAAGCCRRRAGVGGVVGWW
ncbi:hypothetical protein I552_8572 [Mycobacterium xenopi 3993]|nr:hypothetical protein I552_8572 [Mycobacterium xenopi 3993]